MLDQFLVSLTPTLPEKDHSTYPVSHRERDDGYTATIIQFDERWRIILCKNSIQWILQKREMHPGGKWKGQRYFTTKKGLLVACGELNLLSHPRVKKFIEIYSHFVRDSQSDRLLHDMYLLQENKKFVKLAAQIARRDNNEL